MLTGKSGLLVVFFALIVYIISITGCKEDPLRQLHAAEPNKASPRSPAEPNQPPAEPNTPPTTSTAPVAVPTSRDAGAKPVAPASDSNKPTLGRIIAKRDGWAPLYFNWYGEQSPDFTVTDITGKSHTLSDYIGRNVMLVFWATWCGPCKREIPHLYELRKTYPQDKLVILAISYITPNNSARMVKRFVEDNPLMNYPVVSVDMSALPRPYNSIMGIPCSFYIDPQGKIKLATEGLVPVSQMKQIIEAER